MTFHAWQQLSPNDAARTVHTRVRERLPPEQQRAAIALLRPESELTRAFAAAGATAAPLRGVPYFAKDLFDVAGMPTFAGSTFLPEARPPPARDSALIATLRTAGAVLAGKTHLHEFAYGITGENPHYGDVDVPGFPGRTTGGSSSGSVAVVAAGIVPLALGTDTGGSVRLPAAFCGLYGLRLTPGDPFIRDAVALAPSLDTAGWFTAKAEDMRAANAALLPAPHRAAAPHGCYLEMPGVDPDVATACRAAAEQFDARIDGDVSAELRSGFGAALDIYNTIVAVEAWEVHKPWAERFRERYSPAVWQRLNRVHAFTADKIGAAQRGREAIRSVWRKFFETYDFVVLPASPAPAFTKPDCTLENRNRILVLTAPASLAGLPVLTIPIQLSSGLSTGLQLVVKEPASPVIDWALQRCQ
ncbi:MAG: amidase [Opitutaceae bacterium]|nr:amidase [Opitutaceae bacterium]